MDIDELELIETEEGMHFLYKSATRIGAKGPQAAVDRALDRIADHREQVLELMRVRQGVPAEGEEQVEREIAVNIPSKAVQKSNYVAWFTKQSKYYHPSESELEVMFNAVEEGDLVLPDFAHSFTVRKPNGLLVQVDRKGRVSAPSPYSPALQGK